MVRLKNIKKNDSIIEYDVLPETSTNAGHIVVDMKSGELKDYSSPVVFLWRKILRRRNRSERTSSALSIKILFTK